MMLLFPVERITMVKKLPTWFQLSSKVFVSSLLMVLGLITVNPFTVSADTYYYPTAITGDSRLGHFNNGTLTKMYQTNEGKNVTKSTECFFYLTFDEPFVMSSAELSIVINDSRVPTVHIYGSSSSSFTDNYEIGTGSRSSTGILTITTSTSTAYQYYVIGMTSNYKNAGANSVWSIDGSFSNNGGRAYRFSGTTASVTQYTLTTSVSPTGSGTVIGGGTYDDRTSVTLTASANTGYAFDHWENDSNVNLGSSNPFTYVISRDLTITAYFVEDTPTPTPTYTITTNVSPTGSGTVTGGGTYDSGTVVSLSATANSGYTFSQWSDGVTTNPRTVTVSSNATYTAVFEANTPSPTTYTIYVTSNNVNYGDVSPSSITTSSGNSVSLHAYPNTGYIFDRWIEVGSGNTVSTSNPYVFNASQNITYQAVFVVDPNYNQPSINLLVHKNIYNFNIPTEPVIITSFSYPGSQYVNSSGNTVNKTLVAGTDFPYSIEYAVSYNYTVTLYSYKGIRDSIYNHFGNNVTVQSGYEVITYNSTYQAFYSRANTSDGNYEVVCVLYPLPSISNLTLNNAYLAGSYTAGNITYFPDNVGSSTDQLIINGDDNTSLSSGSLDTSTNNMSTEFNEYFTLEDDFLTDMTTSLTDIDVSSDLVTDTNFLAAADWVRTQFNNLTLNTPFGLVVTFTLILGLALLIIGKIR